MGKSEEDSERRDLLWSVVLQALCQLRGKPNGGFITRLLLKQIIE
jgi:hypothetical protein